MRGENASLPFEAEDGTVEVRLAQEDARVVGEVAGREVVGAVHDDVVGANEVERVLAGKAGLVEDNLDVRIEAVKGIMGGFSLGAAEVRAAMENLPVKVGQIHGVGIEYAEFADPGGGEVESHGRAEPARAQAKDAGSAYFVLALEPDFGQSEVPRVAADVVGI